jgi:tRNA G18 (ribose-2'-O)-methylase SpoU
VRIPGGRPGLESLNAGVATAVALSELFRDREPGRAG